MTANGTEFKKPIGEPKKGARKKFSESSFKKILQRIQKGCGVHESIKRQGFAISTFYAHIKDDADKSNALRDARLSGPIAIMEREAFRRGAKGWLEPVFFQGTECGKVRKYSDRMLELCLKAEYPEKYNIDRAQTNISTVVNTSPKPEIVAQIEAADANNNRILAILEERLKR